MQLPTPAGQARTFQMGAQTIDYQLCAARNRMPTVIFLPGLFAGAWMWSRAYRYASMRGYGAVAINAAFAKIPVRGKDPIAQFRLALDELIAELGLERILICGNSLGGLMAIDYAVYGKTPCHALASGIPGIGKVNLPGLMLQRAPSKEEAVIVAQAIFHDQRLISDAMIADALSCFDKQYFVHLLRYLLSVRHYPLIDSMQKIKRKLTVIWGEQDQITPLPIWEQSFACELRAGAFSLVKIADCGHSPMLEKPAEFNSHLGQALRSL